MKNIKITSVLIMMLLTIGLYAQKTAKFQLISTNGEVLQEAYFSYGEQNGTSDERGQIEFIFEPNVSMELSHIGFGKWKLTQDKLEEAITQGVFIVEPRSMVLQPVTVIVMKYKTSEQENVDFTFKENLAYDGGEILKRTPAISGIRKSGSYGFDPVMRGFKYDQLNVVMNGTQCATAACPNRMDPPTSQMAPNMVKRVEILKGPYALRFGGGLGGTINYVTEEPSFDIRKISGRVSGNYDSNNAAYKTEGLVKCQQRKMYLSLLGSLASGNDYRDGSGNYIPADYTRTSVGINAGVKIREKQIIELTAFQNNAKDVDFVGLMMDLRNDKTIMLNASHIYKSGNNRLSEIKTTFFYSGVDHLMDNLLKNLNPRMMDASTKAETVNLGGRSEATLKWLNGVLYAGIDVKQEGAEGLRTRKMLMGPMAGKVFIDNAWQHGTINKTGFFAEYNHSIDDWRLVGSSRIEINKANVLDADQSFLELNPTPESIQINPNISFGALKNIKRNVAIGFWLARVQRSGGLTERYINKFAVGNDPYELIGNPNLRPEINNQMDLTFEYKAKMIALSADVFSSYMQDYITSFIDGNIPKLTPSSPGVRKFENIPGVIKAGFELSASHHLANWLCQNFDLAYTYGQNIENNEALPEIAPLDLRYSLKSHHLKHKLQTEMALRYVAAQNRISKEFGESASASFFTVDLEFGYHNSGNWTVAAGVHNILDATYAEHLNRSTLGMNAGLMNAPGRNFFITSSLSF